MSLCDREELAKSLEGRRQWVGGHVAAAAKAVDLLSFPVYELMHSCVADYLHADAYMCVPCVRVCMGVCIRPHTRIQANGLRCARLSRISFVYWFTCTYMLVVCVSEREREAESDGG